MRGTSKRGSFRGGGFKKSFSKKRSSPDDDDAVPQVSKKARGGGNDEAAALVPELQTDDDNNPFVALKANGTRRVTISDFKGKTLVSIREYYVDDGGDMRPGKKGISLSIEQYNALLAAAPLLESVLVEREEKVVRPEYDSEPAAPVKKDEGGEEKDGEEEAAVEKGEDEEEE